MPSSPIIVLIRVGATLFSLAVITSYSPAADARCPNGYHKSPSGDCEKVTHSGGLPRCSDGYHRSPDGDCEQISFGGSNSTMSSKSNETEYSSDVGQSESINKNNANGGINSLSSVPLTQTSGCKGAADRFTGIVTEIVDGDTIDVNKVRIRLSMVDTPGVRHIQVLPCL
jgi:hypothetical protein